MKQFLKLFSFILPAIIVAQNSNFSKKVQQKLDSFSKIEYQEKAFIHTDKTNYKLGDDIWFSAYLLNASNHFKSSKSFVLYAELINEKDSILFKKKIYMKETSAAGDFKIPKKIKPGKYVIRAYTNYMRNETPSSLFQKEINIWGNKVSKNYKNLEQEEIKPELNFYPEGGYLVNNLKTFVAIKLKNSVFDTLTTNIKILDNLENTITTFTSTNFGLGIFSFTPESNKTYKALVKFAEKDYYYNLPKALPTGEILNVIQNEKELLIHLKSNLSAGLLKSSLVIHQRGNLIYSNTINEQTSNKKLKVPVKTIQDGVLHITLFNAAQKPVAERLIFVNNNKNVNVSIEMPKLFYGNGRKIDVAIAIKDTTKQNLESVFSLTVKDLKNGKSHLKGNIKTWLLLNSDLRGKIDNPNYFFENPNVRKRNYLLDLIMMTNGWRRFTWKNLLSKQPKEKKFKVERGFKITGRTYDMSSKNKPFPAVTRLTFLGRTVEQEPLKKANNLGEFSYGPFVYYDSLPAIIEARKTNFKSERRRERRVLIIKNKEKASPKVYRDSLKIINNKDRIQEQIEYQNFLNNYKDILRQSDYTLDEVVISSNLKTDEERRSKEMSNRTSYGSAFRRFDVENQISTRSTALDIFYSVPGIEVYRDSIYIRNAPNTIPLILYDEIPIDVIELNDINADQVSFIDVLRGEEAYVFTSMGSVVAIYSKQGNGSGLNSTIRRKPGIIDFKAIGFYNAREYYPTDPNDIEMQFKEDPRTTLHWEPIIKINNKKPINLSFYTSDFDSKYVIEIQGITKDGIPFYKTKMFTVD